MAKLNLKNGMKNQNELNRIINAELKSISFFNAIYSMTLRRANFFQAILLY